ncbi:hypothetical protein IIA15_09550 [candidate division TA06 bacterium]|nr:hypothetical protein [candidate division TA06 bacterium]
MKTPEQIVAEIDETEFQGFKVGDLREVFSAYQDPENWKNEFLVYDIYGEEAKKLISAIQFFQGGEPVVWTKWKKNPSGVGEHLVMYIRAMGYYYYEAEAESR